MNKSREVFLLLFVQCRKCFAQSLFLNRPVSMFQVTHDKALSCSPGLSEWEHWSYFISLVLQSLETCFLLLYFLELNCMLGNLRAHIQFLTLPLICCHTHTCQGFLHWCCVLCTVCWEFHDVLNLTCFWSICSGTLPFFSVCFLLTTNIDICPLKLTVCTVSLYQDRQ